MNTKSILLALSGSEQSYQAAQVARNLAQKTASKLVAVHVVDIKKTWAMFGCERAGLVGSGMYVAAYELICQSLRDLGKKLAEKFEAVFPAVECLIVDGDPLDELCRRASDFDLLVVGHRPLVLDESHADTTTQFRYSLAEKLSTLCSKPLLVVQGECKEWANLKILVSVEHLNFRFIDESLNLANRLGLKPKLVCLSSGGNEEPAAKLLPNLRTSHPELANIEIDLIGVGGAVDEHFSTNGITGVEIEAAEEDLFVLPTEKICNKRLSVLGIPTSSFLKTWTLPNVMFYPEENLASSSTELTQESQFLKDQEIVASHTR
ncbi:MAG: universal stress protein [Candidatus Melainabacteria bacterium]|nr:MAG: universal stress protein [Candidatus Melainabacteria bacterium]